MAVALNGIEFRKCLLVFSLVHEKPYQSVEEGTSNLKLAVKKVKKWCKLYNQRLRSSISENAFELRDQDFIGILAIVMLILNLHILKSNQHKSVLKSTSIQNIDLSFCLWKNVRSKHVRLYRVCVCVIAISLNHVTNPTNLSYVAYHFCFLWDIHSF